MVTLFLTITLFTLVWVIKGAWTVAALMEINPAERPLKLINPTNKDAIQCFFYIQFRGLITALALKDVDGFSPILFKLIKFLLLWALVGLSCFFVSTFVVSMFS